MAVALLVLAVALLSPPNQMFQGDDESLTVSVAVDAAQGKFNCFCLVGNSRIVQALVPWVTAPLR